MFLHAIVTFISAEVSKLIATGPKSKSLHKKELGVSVTEQKLKKQVEDKVNMLQGGRSHSSRTAELLKRQSLAAKVHLFYTSKMHTNV